MENLIVHGVKPDSNFGGLEVSVAPGADYLHWRTNYGEPSKWHSAKIYYTANYRTYFIARGVRVYLDEVMRV